MCLFKNTKEDLKFKAPDVHQLISSYRYKSSFKDEVGQSDDDVSVCFRCSSHL